MPVARLRRTAIRIISLFLIILLVLSLYVYMPVWRSPYDTYIARKGYVKSINITRKWADTKNVFREIELVSSTGLNVEIMTREPLDDSKEKPVALILGGAGTGRDACRIIPAVSEVICVALSYPYQGDKDLAGLDYVTGLRSFQQMIMDTPPAVLLVMDYLYSPQYKKVKNVELIGVSFGAYFASIPAVMDKRIKRLWLVQGGAEPHKVIGHNLLKNSGSELLKTMAGYTIGYALGGQHVDPALWVGEFSPRSVIIINTLNDSTFPETSVRALHEAAQEPKEVIWIKGEHVRPYREEVIQQLSDIVIRRIESEHTKVNN